MAGKGVEQSVFVLLHTIPFDETPTHTFCVQNTRTRVYDSRVFAMSHHQFAILLRK